ncbi:MAG: hypothetical protein Q4C43_04545 [Prevotella sp.]|nr:hypothetical protein [Prevotella sp.]
MRLKLQPLAAGFVVAYNTEENNAGRFTKKAGRYNPWAKETAKPVEGEWTLTFDRALGGPEKPIVTAELTDFSKSSDPAVKYFSGLCTYDNTFRLDRKPAGRMALRIPGLHGAARVVVNGKEAGFIWCTPWEVDITPFVKKGRNRISIEVRNSLANRLIGDAALPEAQRKTWIFTQLYKATSHLKPSGIDGQVLLIEKNM